MGENFALRARSLPKAKRRRGEQNSGELLRQLPRIEFAGFTARLLGQFGLGEGVTYVVGSGVADGKLVNSEVSREGVAAVVVVEGSNAAARDITAVEGKVAE